MGGTIISVRFWRRRADLNRCIEVLQTSPLPLGYAAELYIKNFCRKKMERVARFELVTPTLARLCSTS